MLQPCSTSSTCVTWYLKNLLDQVVAGCHCNLSGVICVPPPTMLQPCSTSSTWVTWYLKNLLDQVVADCQQPFVFHQRQCFSTKSTWVTCWNILWQKISIPGTTAIFIISESQLQVFQRFFSSKLVLKAIAAVSQPSIIMRMAVWKRWCNREREQSCFSNNKLTPTNSHWRQSALPHSTETLCGQCVMGSQAWPFLLQLGLKLKCHCFSHTSLFKMQPTGLKFVWAQCHGHGHAHCKSMYTCQACQISWDHN
jgi:hypothetical protein